jgi:hypothetical protein
MMDQIFDSIYVDSQAVVEPERFVLALVTSLVLGVCVAQVYKYKTLYTREFVILLAILPSLISILIFLVNGNLGTSVAVAGVFGLIRFRSAAGGAKELLSLFIAMAIGLAAGTGYLILAILSAAFLLGATLLFESTDFAKTNHRRRQVTLTIPDDFDYEVLLEVILLRLCHFVELTSVKSKTKNNTLTLNYMVDLKPEINDKALIEELMTYKEDISIAVSKEVVKKKSL